MALSKGSAKILGVLCSYTKPALGRKASSHQTRNMPVKTRSQHAAESTEQATEQSTGEASTAGCGCAARHTLSPEEEFFGCLEIRNELSPTYGFYGSKFYFFETEVQRRVYKQIPRGFDGLWDEWCLQFYLAIRDAHVQDREDLVKYVCDFVSERLLLHARGCFNFAEDCSRECIEKKHIVFAVVSETSIAMNAAYYILGRDA